MNPAPAEATQRRGVKEGWDVLRRAHDLCPDLVLLDLMLPGLNGWEVCRRLRQDPEARGGSRKAM